MTAHLRRQLNALPSAVRQAITGGNVITHENGYFPVVPATIASLINVISTSIKRDFETKVSSNKISQFALQVRPVAHEKETSSKTSETVNISYVSKIPSGTSTWKSGTHPKVPGIIGNMSGKIPYGAKQCMADVADSIVYCLAIAINRHFLPRPS